MTDTPDQAECLKEHLLKLQAAGMIPMTVEEILGGETQAMVPRPAFLTAHDDDGTVEFVTHPGATP